MSKVTVLTPEVIANTKSRHLGTWRGLTVKNKLAMVSENLCRILLEQGYNNFKHIGAGTFADVYDIGNGHVLRISCDKPQLLPENIPFNPRIGLPFMFDTDDDHYFEISKRLKPCNRESVEAERYLSFERKLHMTYTLDHRNIWDIHPYNLGYDIDTDKLFIIDYGCIRNTCDTNTDICYSPVIVYPNRQAMTRMRTSILEEEESLKKKRKSNERLVHVQTKFKQLSEVSLKTPVVSCIYSS